MLNLFEIIYEILYFWEIWVGFEINRYIVFVLKLIGYIVFWKLNIFINYVYIMLVVNWIWYFRINN